MYIIGAIETAAFIVLIMRYRYWRVIEGTLKNNCHSGQEKLKRLYMKYDHMRTLDMEIWNVKGFAEKCFEECLLINTRAVLKIYGLCQLIIGAYGVWLIYRLKVAEALVTLSAIIMAVIIRDMIDIAGLKERVLGGIENKIRNTERRTSHRRENQDTNREDKQLNGQDKIRMENKLVDNQNKIRMENKQPNGYDSLNMKNITASREFKEAVNEVFFDVFGL